MFADQDYFENTDLNTGGINGEDKGKQLWSAY